MQILTKASDKMAVIRLFVENDHMSEGYRFFLPEKSVHYLVNVMKRVKGNKISLFNGKDGEFEAELVFISKKSAEVEIIRKTKDFKASEDIWLLFAPIKKDNTDFVIEKATELGVGCIVPVITKNTISGRVRTDRFKAQAVEAAEQSGRLDVPRIYEAVKLNDLLKSWDVNRKLFFMDESGNGEIVCDVFKNAYPPAAILVGPEGGFAKEELDFLRSLPYTVSTSLGPLILRAETASVAALACWQSLSGNWK